jgi:quinol monooxygenase YgiN
LPLTVVLEWTATTGREHRIRELAHWGRSECVRQPGCLGCSTFTDMANPSVIAMLSNWSSERHWAAWRASSSYRELQDRISAHLRGPAIVKVYREMGPVPVTSP